MLERLVYTPDRHTNIQTNKQTTMYLYSAVPSVNFSSMTLQIQQKNKTKQPLL